MGLWNGLFHRHAKRSISALSWQRERRETSEAVYLDDEGRRRRGDAPYLLPKDEQEIHRLDYQHFILRQVLKGNCFAPVEPILRTPCQVLDVGCGTGRWGCEIAETFPQTLVTGLDLEEVPRSAPLPPNYTFQQGNLLNGLPFADQTFQYVHQCLLVAGIPLERWVPVVRELKRVTTPGGWIELVEMGNTFHRAGPATQQFLDWWVAIGQERGMDASRMSQIGTFLQVAGLIQIKKETKTLPVGAWGGRIGNLLAQNMLAGWPGIRPLVHTQLGVDPLTFNAVLGQLLDEWNSYKTEYEIYFACGRA